MSEETKRERFGRYLILDHLVDGGMAKICRARFLGDQADKVVAIKMVQPQYSQDEAFKTMFMDEIKLTFGLIHPNIVQTYDYGLHKGQLFVAMEYCDGRNLKEYLDKLKERKFVFPVEISTYIVTQVCQGLHYAHTYTDKLTGKTSNIIHRDISPHNIMLTYDGSIKVIDFGIAKADTNSEATQAGTIKGKLSYLAPEYLEGEELDPNYDQFAVGITLWEMLCSRKLFKASNDLAVLKKIQECKIPAPSSINPNVPKELDQIVLKSLSKDRNKRFENMDKMNRALMKFLYTNYPDFNATDLAYFAKELFKTEIKKDREKLFEYGKIDLVPYLEDMKKEAESGGVSSDVASDSGGNSSGEPKRQKERVLDFGFEEEDKSKATKVKRSSKKKKPVNVEEKFSHLSDQEPDMKLDVGAGGPQERTDKPGDGKVSKKSKSGTKTVRKKTGTRTVAKKSQTKKSTKTSLSKRNGNKKSSNKNIIVAASIAALALVGVFFFTGDDVSDSANQVAHNSGGANGSGTQGVSVDERAPSSKEATVQFTNFNQHNQSVYVNGNPERAGVLGDVRIPAGEDVAVRVQTPGREHFVLNVNLEHRETQRVEIPSLPRTSYAYLIMSRPCVEGKLVFELFGEQRVEDLPLSRGVGVGFPIDYGSDGRAVASDHTIYLKKDGEDIERALNFTASEPDESVDLCRIL